MFSSLNHVLPTSLGVIHFIGIGGIGMSGIAEILHSLGYKVQGSDQSESYVTDRLTSLGIKVFFTHDEKNVDGVSLIVKSTAISDDNPEMVRAANSHIPVIKRSEMLAEIMRFKHSISVSGTHGKTTTTALVAHLLEKASLAPTVINGGIIEKKGTNAYVGHGDLLVAEADESDGTFIKVPSYVAVITNIDPEHMDYYKHFENAIGAYRAFVNNLPFYGFGVLCYDHPIVKELGRSIRERKILSYGILDDSVDFFATNISTDGLTSEFDVMLSENYVAKKRLNYSEIKNVQLSLLGNHNISNSLAAIAVGVELGIEPSVIASAFAEMSKIKRRFTKTGEVDGILVIDDYAHHPVEVIATLSTARNVANVRNGRVIAILQPHRYTRLRDLMDDFARSFSEADYVYISDVYAASEKPIKGVGKEALIEKALSHNNNVSAVDSPEDIPQIINKLARHNDVVVFLGAGSITKWAYELPKELEKLRKSAA